MAGAAANSRPEIDPEPVLRWFADQGRDLPWRNTRDPWAILVSELMLQQTQAIRVVDRLPRFLDRFPTPTACAAAEVSAVIEEWAGLGYNRRAVNLHRAATTMVDRFDGRVPATLDDLLALPGIGPYTARAVRVFAFEFDDGVVDTNIGRVLARVAGRRLGPSEVQEIADGLVPHGLGWEWNQSLMEVGALLCRPKVEACGRCPIRSRCVWHLADHPQPDPSRKSARVSTGQSTFEGSDRQGRGRLIDALRSGPVSQTDVARAMGWPDDDERAHRVARTLIRDGLAVVDEDGAARIWRLPS